MQLFFFDFVTDESASVLEWITSILNKRSIILSLLDTSNEETSAVLVFEESKPAFLQPSTRQKNSKRALFRRVLELFVLKFLLN